MTILEALTWGKNNLKAHLDADPDTGARLDSLQLDVEVLLGATLEKPRTYLFAHMDEDVPTPQVEAFQRLVERRRNHEPVAYLTGKKEFFGREFHVNPFVLIPRPETELLVEVAIQLFSQSPNDTCVVDIGTGPGTVALTIAAETQHPVIATEISERALALARQNAERLAVTDLVTFFHGNLLDPAIRHGTCRIGTHMIITANLPYLTTRQWQAAQAEVARYEPRIALDGGVDGLDAYHALFDQIKNHRAELPREIIVLCEIDPDQHESLPRLAASIFPHATSNILADLANLPRLAIIKI